MALTKKFLSGFGLEQETIDEILNAVSERDAYKAELEAVTEERDAYKAEAERRVYVVAYANGVNLRDEPSKDSTVLRVLSFGETVEPEPDAEVPEGWLAVKGGGYVMTKYLK